MITIGNRKSILTTTLALTTLLFLSESKSMGQCGTVVTRKRVINEVVVVKEVIATPAVVAYLQPLFIPAYGAGYNPNSLGSGGTYPNSLGSGGTYPSYVQPSFGQGGVQQQVPNAAQQGQSNTRDDAILKELQRLNSRLDALEKKSNIVPMGRVDPGEQTRQEGNTNASSNSAILGILGSKCAACHTQDKSEKLGGGFTFLSANGPRKMSDVELRKVTKKVKNGTMPPPDNKVGITALTQEEGNALLNWVEDQ